MTDQTNGKSLIAVVGPTGSGKSDLGLELALEFGGEIVNCDSIQLYRHLHIGSAKTSLSERRGVPHHLIDILEPDQIFTAGDYVRAARQVLDEVASRARIPIIVGGTGFYFRAMRNGLFAGPGRDDQLRERLSRRSPERLHRLLMRLDSRAGNAIHPNDTKKVIRALEVCILTRIPLTAQYEQGRKPLEDFRTLIFGLDPPRSELSERIDRRVIQMFDAGLIQEVRRILELGFSPKSKALESIGYQETLEHLRGGLSLQQAIERTQAGTRQYAKRQRTWFRREEGVTWLPAFGNQEETIETAKRTVRVWLEHAPE